MLGASRRLVRLVGLAMLALIIGLLTACTPTHPQSTFDTLGPVAESQLELFYVLFWVGLAVFVLVTGATLYATIRYRRRPGQGDPEQIHGHTQLEIAWTIVPALLQKRVESR